jgi:hypothetical protein
VTGRGPSIHGRDCVWAGISTRNRRRLTQTKPKVMAEVHGDKSSSSRAATTERYSAARKAKFPLNNAVTRAEDRAACDDVKRSGLIQNRSHIVQIHADNRPRFLDANNLFSAAWRANVSPAYDV